MIIDFEDFISLKKFNKPMNKNCKSFFFKNNISKFQFIVMINFLTKSMLVYINYPDFFFQKPDFCLT